MLNLLLKRLLSAIPLLLFLSFFVYLLVDLMPGDAAANLAGDNASAADIAALREQLGLDRPLVVRYIEWLGNIFSGDFGTSLYSSQTVTQILTERMPITLSLALVTMVIVVLVGLPLGIIAAMRANSLLDRTLTAFSSIAMAVPPFIIGLVLVIVLAISSPIFPATGYSPLGDGFVPWFQHLILPAIAIAVISIAEVARQTRAAMVDTLGKDFIRTTRAKGLRSKQIVGKHALKVAGAPIATVLGLQVSRVLAGAVTVEFVFALPGLGTLAVNSVFSRDIPVILGIVMVMAVAIVIINLIVDMAYGYFNPRVRA
ncbi:peptide/nickel transport system permease protein [Rhodococcus rhodochrous J3]|uniref:ABC transporter permease n=2 Tax=Rhodococcus rhodochrous TaxID=1829 RepID=A0AA47A9X8_RHORH|nr:ABC transporter permease [Rhodococcus rhodochrous]MBF4476769.1 ABC transporter permease [Rhodococcus rhodochrous]MCD2099283.1 ABC transporter permease [Rhodococcus rhodochrous]MCD2123712.1 ABC transporter permease [Rhodococcus rhodochrous]MCQ4136259.1 ABC transporter permease [Rhodococcus rhodochrous]MDJ0020508.1 ABC transporter permease [Rhodococcus rhodochrous]